MTLHPHLQALLLEAVQDVPAAIARLAGTRLDDHAAYA